jgi:hypothetical protein
MSAGPDAHRLEQELASELGARHPLKGRDLRSIAMRQDCDDVLFASVDDPTVVAVVHLTYANRPESDPRSPETTIFASIEDWLERGMKQDHEDFTSSGARGPTGISTSVRRQRRSVPADPAPNPDFVSDEASFLAFVRALEADRRLAAILEKQDHHIDGAHRGWQNSTIEQFLESAAAWAEDSRFGSTQGLSDGVSPWRRFAIFLYAGKIYE